MNDSPDKGKQNKLFFLGIIISFLSAFWWHNELHSFFGEELSQFSFRCLLNFGTGDCANLWFLGFHQTNQFASVIFYAGLALAFYALSNKDRKIYAAIAAIVMFFNIVLKPSTPNQVTEDNAPQAISSSKPSHVSKNNNDLFIPYIDMNSINAVVQECRSKRLKGELKNYVASANCSNSKILKIYQDAKYPFSDLVELLIAKRLSIGEKIDAGEITEAQGQAESTQFANQLNNVEKERISKKKPLN